MFHMYGTRLTLYTRYSIKNFFCTSTRRSVFLHCEKRVLSYRKMTLNINWRVFPKHGIYQVLNKQICKDYLLNPVSFSFCVNF